jgi:hypothetical protein
MYLEVNYDKTASLEKGLRGAEPQAKEGNILSTFGHSRYHGETIIQIKCWQNGSAVSKTFEVSLSVRSR